MENHLKLTDTETNKKYYVMPTKIAETLAKIERVKKCLRDGHCESAINILESATKAADSIICECVYDPAYEDPTSGAWNDELLIPVDYDSFYVEEGPTEI